MTEASNSIDLVYRTTYVQREPSFLLWCGTVDHGRKVGLPVGVLDPQAEWIKAHSDLSSTASFPFERFSAPHFLRRYIEEPLIPMETEAENFFIYPKELEWDF